ncbi:hypothetical protein CRG98_018766 [Punica granatum]|uniref:Uncharacterized protein n=1 Tax=Punica granatum TaxID=22663 RepID=A0A2I0JX18_PUNGR|nr:hypothetical protein CRG98_018766 [Punica granatum]
MEEARGSIDRAFDLRGSLERRIINVHANTVLMSLILTCFLKANARMTRGLESWFYSVWMIGAKLSASDAYLHFCVLPVFGCRLPVRGSGVPGASLGRRLQMFRSAPA